MGNIIQMPKRDVPHGVREALRDAMASCNYLPHENLTSYDHLLAELWMRGFKVVPLEDKSLLSISGMDVIIDPSVPEGMILVKDSRAKEIICHMIFATPKDSHRG